MIQLSEFSSVNMRIERASEKKTNRRIDRKDITALYDT